MNKALLLNTKKIFQNIAFYISKIYIVAQFSTQMSEENVALKSSPSSN